MGLGADLMADFSEPIGGTKDYRAFQMSLSFGWVRGKGHSPAP